MGISSLFSFDFHFNSVKWLLQKEKLASLIPAPSSHPSLDHGVRTHQDRKAGQAGVSWGMPLPLPLLPCFLLAQQALAKSDSSMSSDHKGHTLCGQQLENTQF